MNRRYSVMTFGEWVIILAASLAVVSIFCFLLLGILLLNPAIGHEGWINRGGFKNGAGEFCCGDYDCKSYASVSSEAKGWIIDGELVPYDEAMPVAPPDGKLTVCRRPDGTRRCVFGVRP